MEAVPLPPVYACILASGMTAHVKGQELWYPPKGGTFLGDLCAHQHEIS